MINIIKLNKKIEKLKAKQQKICIAKFFDAKIQNKYDKLEYKIIMLENELNKLLDTQQNFLNNFLEDEL